MDALPIKEATEGGGVQSEVPGVMHACGHDAHMVRGGDCRKGGKWLCRRVCGAGNTQTLHTHVLVFVSNPVHLRVVSFAMGRPFGM